MKPSATQERPRIWRLPELGNVELMHPTYVTQTFPRHAHDGFAIGVIEHGALGFYYRCGNGVAQKGAINLANPDEAHTGHAAAESGWTYRMFYFDADLLKKARGIAQTAFETGFSDQSHLTRHFKRITGITPGRYSKIVQDGRR